MQIPRENDVAWRRGFRRGSTGWTILLAGVLLTGCTTTPPGGPLALQTPSTGEVAPATPEGALQPALPEQGEGDVAGGGGSFSPVAFPFLEDSTPQSAPPAVTGKAYLVANVRSGKILVAHNAHLQLPVASTQKLLTALVVLDAGNLDQFVTVAASDTQVEPTTMGIRSGERYRRKDLLEAMMVRSSNDIAKCLARAHSGSEARFVVAMNAKARALGMQESHFVNSHGLSRSGGYSTAFDLAILARAAMNHSYLHRLTETRETDFRFADGRVQHLWNTNRVLFMSPYCRGLKTGYTEAAGRCLVSCGERGGRRVVAVVLGSRVPEIWTDSVKLLHWALGVSGPT